MIEAIKGHLSRKNKGMSAAEVEDRAQQILAAYQQAKARDGETGEEGHTAAFSDSRVTWSYTKGHDGDPHNERCDEIAQAFSRGERPNLAEC
jgi:ribonuclease HI